jgi:RNA polymerase sigma-70 factor (family 1)
MNSNQPNSRNDAELLDLIRAADSFAFKELYDRYWEELLDMAYKRLGSIEIAEEIVQDIFVSLFVRREELKITSSLEGYLKNALKYKIFDVFRSMATHNKYITTLLHQPLPYCPTPESSLEAKELSHEINLVTDRLPVKCREVFLLSRIEQMSNKSIAQKLGISVSTVEKHIGKAMSIMKTGFSKFDAG